MIAQADFLPVLHVEQPPEPPIPRDAYKFKVCPNVHATDWCGEWHTGTRAPSLHVYAVRYCGQWWAFCDHEDGNGQPHGPHKTLARALHDTHAPSARDTSPRFAN